MFFEENNLLFQLTRPRPAYFLPLTSPHLSLSLARAYRPLFWPSLKTFLFSLIVFLLFFFPFFFFFFFRLLRL